MPLKRGSSKAVIGSNIRELVGTYKSSGRIGTSKPANKTAAIKQAIAISMNKSREKRMKEGGMVDPVFQGSNRSNAEAIRKAGGRVVYRRDAKRPVGIY